MRAFLARMRDAFRRRAIARHFDEEMAFHLEELEREAIGRGESPEQARITAARAFGNVMRTREDLRRRAGFPAWDEMIDDVRYVVRGLIRRPFLSSAVILILTLGLGAAATVCGLIDGVFFQPLSVPHPEQLYTIIDSDTTHHDRVSRGTVRRLEALLPPDSVAAYNGGVSCTVQIGDQPAIRVSTRAVNGAFFPTLGLVPLAGRLLAPADDVPGAPAEVVVASYRWAKTNFGQAEAALGRELLVNRERLAIVGILPPGFRDVAVGQTTDLWFATALQPRLHVNGSASSFSADDRRNDPDWNREERVSWLEVLLRSRPGIPIMPAVVARAWAPQRDDMALGITEPKERERLMHRAWTLEKAPAGRSRFRNGFHATAWLLGGIVTVLLVLVSANVSGLLLVHSMARHREIGVRLALGAGPWRVIRFSVLEVLGLTGAGALGGFALASLMLPIAAHLLGAGDGLRLAMGWRPILLMGALMLFSAFVSAIGPGLWISRVQPLRALSGNGGIGRAPVRFGRALVIAQFAIAVALVATAGALGEALQRALAVDVGFDREHVVTIEFDSESAGYRTADVSALLERLRSAALAVPAVKRVSFADNGVLTGNHWSSGLYFRDPRARGSAQSYAQDAVEPGYFLTLGTPLLTGRDFAATDGLEGQPVAIISASFARQVFGNANPIGQVFGYDPAPSKQDWTVIGVVADVRMDGVRQSAPAIFYTSTRQANGDQVRFIAVRFEGAEAAAIPALRAAFARVEPGVLFTGWKTLQERVIDFVGRDVATARFAWVFGGFALVLAAAGVAGSLGHLVSLRQRELALRMAIGAEGRDLTRSVLFDAARLCAVGAAIGITAVLVVPLIPVVKPVLSAEPGLGPALVAAALALTAAALGGWIPARRAARIDPMLTLKSQ